MIYKLVALMSFFVHIFRVLYKFAKLFLVYNRHETLRSYNIISAFTHLRHTAHTFTRTQTLHVFLL